MNIRNINFQSVVNYINRHYLDGKYISRAIDQIIIVIAILVALREKPSPGFYCAWYCCTVQQNRDDGEFTQSVKNRESFKDCVLITVSYNHLFYSMAISFNIVISMFSVKTDILFFGLEFAQRVMD